MLHFQVIEPEVLELLVQLQKIWIFSELRLVGGTSLALQLGHRKSIDIDLFGRLNADEFEISESLKIFSPINLINKTKNIFIYSINNIKVDIVNYPYEWLENAITSDDIKLADKKDIAALKLAAIAGRGSKKDFIDIYSLLQFYTLKDMLGFYNKKYYDGSEFLVIKSLTYFNDADEDSEPFMLNNIEWDAVKEKILYEVGQYMKG